MWHGSRVKLVSRSAAIEQPRATSKMLSAPSGVAQRLREDPSNTSSAAVQSLHGCRSRSCPPLPLYRPHLSSGYTPTHYTSLLPRAAAAATAEPVEATTSLRRGGFLIEISITASVKLSALCWCPSGSLSALLLDTLRLCAGRELLSNRPELAAQWHPTANVPNTPDTVTTGSRLTATWLCNACPCGHSHVWTAKVADRTSHLRTRCPVCAGKKPCVCGSLTVLHPDVAAQWDYDRNSLSPEQMRPRSNKVVHWLCSEHSPPHSWAAAIAARTKKHGSGCPDCAKQRRVGPHEGDKMFLLPTCAERRAHDLSFTEGCCQTLLMA